MAKIIVHFKGPYHETIVSGFRPILVCDTWCLYPYKKIILRIIRQQDIKQLYL